MASKLILGCGYLGLRVAALWRRQNHRVFATTRKPERFDELRTLGVEPVLSDVLERDSLRSLPAVDTLLYCVGLDRAAGHSMRRVYVEGLTYVIDALMKIRRMPARFMYVSSTSVYGQTDGAEVDESAATEPLEESGRVVLEAERLLRERLPTALVLRFAGIYGPNRWLREKALRAGEPLSGDMNKWLNLIHVEDGAATVLAAEEHGDPGATYNVSDGHPVRRREFYEQLAKHLGAPLPRFVAPFADTELVNRRIANQKMRKELAVQLRYPSYQYGLSASFGNGRFLLRFAQLGHFCRPPRPKQAPAKRVPVDRLREGFVLIAERSAPK